MYELSRWHKLDMACISLPVGTSGIRHVSETQRVQVRYNGYQLSSWCIRSGMYQLSGGYVRSGMYQLSSRYIRSSMCQLSTGYTLDPACISGLVGASKIRHVSAVQRVQVRSGMYQLP